MDLQHLYNPRMQFIAAANNPLSHNHKFYISSFNADASRAKRIHEMIIGNDDYYYRDAHYMQNDILSNCTKDIWLHIKNIFSKYKHLFTKEELKAYYKLSE